MTGLFASRRCTVVLRYEGISQAGSKCNERLGSREKQLKSGTVRREQTSLRHLIFAL